MKTTKLATTLCLRYGLLVIAAALLFTACRNSGDYLPNKKYPVRLEDHATLGAYLTDEEGRTLYYFANDSVTVNTCMGGCAALWPVFHAKINNGKLFPGLQLEDFGEITTSAGVKQTTYKGRPLYYYAPSVNGTNTPEAPREVKGEGVGGVWFVAKPDYTIMLTRAQLVGLDNNNYVFDTTTAPTPAYSVGNRKSIYFTDANGVSLYIFRPDKYNTNTYTSATDMNKNNIWPIYEMDKIVVPSALDKSLFSVITVHGKKQLTYKGWPLYYFGEDEKKMGATKGVSVPRPGVWPIGTRGLLTAPNP